MCFPIILLPDIILNRDMLSKVCDKRSLMNSRNEYNAVNGIPQK